MPDESEVQAKLSAENQKKLTDKIRTETGFEGVIRYNRITGRLSYLSQRYPKHSVKNRDDVVPKAQSLLKKYAAYFQIDLNQIKLDNDINRGCRVRFNQEVNGFDVEPHAEVEVCIPMHENELFVYSSSFVPDIKVATSSHLSQAAAMQIFSREISQKNISLFPSKLLISSMYNSDYPDPVLPGKYYQFCWKIPFSYSYQGQRSSWYQAYIDAHSGTILGVK
jgi:hypothetical protein